MCVWGWGGGGGKMYDPMMFGRVMYSLTPTVHGSIGEWGVGVGGGEGVIDA